MKKVDMAYVECNNVEMWNVGRQNKLIFQITSFSLHSVGRLLDEITPSECYLKLWFFLNNHHKCLLLWILPYFPWKNCMHSLHPIRNPSTILRDWQPLQFQDTPGGTLHPFSLESAKSKIRKGSFYIAWIFIFKCVDGLLSFNVIFNGNFLVNLK